MNYSLTEGNLFKGMLRFSIPYLIACFLQTFYGMADLFITGQFNGAAQVTAVSIGSQMMHMFTVIIVGLAMGTTIMISIAVGAKDKKNISLAIGNSITGFAILSVACVILLLLNAENFLNLLQTPTEAMEAAGDYLFICFLGSPFIVAYNLISSIYRGLGDTRSPMIYVAIAGIINIGLDYALVGGMSLGAAGAAIATVASQAISVLLALYFSGKIRNQFSITRESFTLRPSVLRQLLTVGGPIAAQDGLIQISFLVITMIANSRGLAVATAVGIVEKIISFLFLVPSAMLSTVSAVTAQNIGAGNEARGRQTLRYGVLICITFGAMVTLICQFAAPQIVSLFVKNEPEVVIFGGQYLRTYSLDCIFAGIHFCFSGYFSAYSKSMYSFAHNLISILLVRIPGTYLAARLFPATLLPMGLAAPAGSLLSALICVGLYLRLNKRKVTSAPDTF